MGQQQEQQQLFVASRTERTKLFLNGPLKIPISSVSTEYSRKEQITKQNKTKQKKMPQGRGVT